MCEDSEFLSIHAAIAAWKCLQARPHALPDPLEVSRISHTPASGSTGANSTDVGSLEYGDTRTFPEDTALVGML